MKTPRYWRIRIFDVILLAWLALILMDRPASAQAVRFDSDATTVNNGCAPGKQCNILSLPGTQVNFCSGQNAGVVNTSGKVVTWVSGQVFSTSWTGQISINGTRQQIQFVTDTTHLTLVASVGTLTGVVYSSLSACLASPATTYTDFTAGSTCPTTAQLTPQTGSACLSTADLEGNFGGWFLPGQYSYYLRVPTTAGGGTYGPYPINVGASAGCPLGVTCDANFATLPLACAAAGTGTLYLTRTWSALTTQSIACNIQALANGIIKPASGQTVTLTKSFDGDLTQHFDLSAGGAVSLQKVGVVWPDWFGAKPYNFGGSGSTFDNAVALTGLISALPQGGTIKFSTTPSGYAWYFGSSFSTASLTNSTFQILGQGVGAGCGTSGTCLVFAAGVSGVKLLARGSPLTNIWVHSLSSGSGSDVGVTLGNSWLYLNNVGVDGFGKHNISNEGNNIDNSTIQGIQTYTSFGDGMRLVGSDVNNLHVDTVRMLSNAGWGCEASGISSTYINMDAEGNTSGGCSDVGVGNRWIKFYCEGLATATFSESGTNAIFENSAAGECAVTNTGGPSNVMYTHDPASGLFVQNGVAVGPQAPQTASPKIYQLNSAQSCTGCFTVQAITDSLNALLYNPAGAGAGNATWKYNGYLTPVSGSLMPIINPSVSGPVGWNFIGLNNANAPATYGQIVSTPSNNTAGSQSGGVRINGVNAGTPTAGIDVDADGTTHIKSGTSTVYRCSVAGAARAGALTTVSADCGTAIDTGLKVN